MDVDPNEKVLEDLLTLGFDVAACQEVLTDGFTDINNAIERLLLKSNEKNDTVRRNKQDSNLVTNQSCENKIETFDDDADKNQPIVMESEQDGTVYLIERDKEDDKTPVKSRCELSQKQQQIKEDFLAKERLEAQLTYQRKRKEKIDERKRVLKQIDDDKKERHKNKTEVSPGASNIPEVSTQSQKSIITPSSKNNTDGHLACHLSIRLPNGKAQKLEFDGATLLKDVVSTVYPMFFEPNEAFEYSIIQPYPKKLLTSSDMSKNLAELNLLPSSVLVIQCANITSTIQLDSSEMTCSTADTGVSAEHNLDHSVETSKHQNTENACDENLPNNSKANCLKSRLLNDIYENQTKKVDENSINDSKEPDNSMSANSSPNKKRRSNIAFIEAMNERKKMNQERNFETHHHIHREIPCLETLCSTFLAKLISRLNPLIVNSVHNLRHYQAKVVVQSLKEMSLLNPKNIHLFIPCRLQEMNLDFYKLCTNELIEKLRWHGSLKKLSLSSSPFITDASLLIALKGLEKLEYLNLNNCDKLTSRVLEGIKGLKSLKVLILDKIKLSNDKLNLFLKEALPTLQQISLNECKISEQAFQEITKLTSLISLSLRGTKITSCTNLNNFPNLSYLSLQKTNITDDHITSLSCLKHLKVLELAGTHVSNEGLACLKGLHLEKLSLPDRLTTDTSTIEAIHGLPLTVLDLSDHINIDDSSLEYISKMNSLTNLLLSNTKITDMGLRLLEPLRNLEILDLSRCSITDEVVYLFQNFRLHTLNLSQTKISDDAMILLSKCINLQKLNLSATFVTDKGCLHLKLPYLRNLFLDHTEVTWEGAQLCLNNCGVEHLLVRNSKYKIFLQK